MSEIERVASTKSTLKRVAVSFDLEGMTLKDAASALQAFAKAAEAYGVPEGGLKVDGFSQVNFPTPATPPVSTKEDQKESQ